MTQNNESAAYPSHAAAGLVTVEIPYMAHIDTGEGIYPRSDMRPHGANQPDACERIQARNFGPHVIAKVEREFQYRGPIAASATLAHYAVHGESSVLDSHAGGRMRSMADAMPKASDPEKYFRETVTPFLRELTPSAR